MSAEERKMLKLAQQALEDVTNPVMDVEWLLSKLDPREVFSQEEMEDAADAELLYIESRLQ